MRVSLKWIERLLGVASLGVADAELVRRLTMHLAEIEELERTGPGLDGVVVGRVVSCQAHPDADRLRCCTVDVGGAEPLPIVCGAPNVAAGQSVAVATIGTTLTMTGDDGQEQSLTIRKGKLRGQPSHGMICAEDELGLGSDHSGILVLPGEPAPGTPLAAALGLGDRVLVVDNHNINHRPDLWGHLGWAREIAALCELPPPPAPSIDSPVEPGAWSVRIEDDGCCCYRGAVVEGVANIPSPDWMREALEACGQRSLGLLVDLTNFVMLELGEPMHAFDRRQIGGETIIVRAAAEGEAFTTLDERQHQLCRDDLLIADENRALALAGVMGGLDSMIAEDTDTIVLEAATFRQGRIRKTRQRTGCSSESASRFEKGLGVELTAAAIERAIAILSDLLPEAQVTARFVAGLEREEPRRIAFDPALTDRCLGLAIEAERQYELLERIGCHREGDAVTVPWWRHKDLEAAIDLVEEVGRLHGYDRIRPEVPRLPAAAPHPNPLRETEHRLRRHASALGWDEVATYAFTSEDWATALAWPQERLLRLQHPLSSEQTVLRLSLLPTLLEAVAANRRHLDQVRCYEIGKIYGRGIGHGACADERLVIAGACCCDGDETPFYQARDAAVALLAGLGHTVAVVADEQPGPEAQAGRAAHLLIDGRCWGQVAEIPQTLGRRLRLSEAVAHFHIALEDLLEAHGETPPLRYAPVSRFPAVQREFTFVCPESLSWAELETHTRRAAGSLTRAVELVTVYRGDPIPAGSKAVSLLVRLQADDRTLGESDLDKAQQRIIRTVEERTPARLRA